MKCVVVEDSRLAREGLVRMLAEFPELSLVGQAEHPDSALVLIRATRPDVIFLDIHMPGASGFDLLAMLDYTPRIVFTTAYADYAIRSFDFNTVDYLLKPISAERLAAAVAKLRGEAQESDVTPAPLSMDSKIFVKDGERCHLVSLAAIHYIESCKNYVQIFFGKERAYVKKSLNSVEQRLPASHFFRANRQCVINLQEIKSIEESISLGYDVTMNDGRVVEISRRNAAELKDRLSF
ncbi:MAG: LytTR family DNA-binding domain-containing protein [Pseudomonadota bacterium]